jgi:pimeloyl-ACP methyl ester carboxylesterase
MSGSDDPSTPPEHGRRIAELIPGAAFELIPDARHIANIERADVVTPLIERFLESSEQEV